MPFRELGFDDARGWPLPMPRLWSELDRWFNPRIGRMGLIEPPADMWETAENLVIRAELPGVDPGDIQVNATEDSIKFQAQVHADKEIPEEGYFRRERRYGHVMRFVALPKRIQPDKVRAAYRAGVLTITMPKQEQEKDRSVPVRVESDETGYASTRRLQETEERRTPEPGHAEPGHRH